MIIPLCKHDLMDDDMINCHVDDVFEQSFHRDQQANCQSNVCMSFHSSLIIIIDERQQFDNYNHR